VKYSYPLAGLAPEVFELASDSGHRITAVSDSRHLTFRLVEKPRDGGNVRFTFSSLSFQHSLAEPVPFNRSIIAVDFLWCDITPPATRLIISRPGGFVTVFTTGNYSLAYPSRTTKHSTETHIFFAPNPLHCIEYGYSSDERADVIDLLSTILMTLVSSIAFWFLCEYVFLKPDTDLSQGILPLVALLLPMYVALSRYANLDRLQYYLRRSPISLSVLLALTVITIVNTSLFMYALFSGHKQAAFSVIHITVFAATLDIHLSWLYLSEAVASAVVFGSLIALSRSGFLIRYVCDNVNCDARLYFRFRLANCYSTGRIMCSGCYDALCAKCASNTRLNPTALETTGVIYNEQRCENLCGAPERFTKADDGI
jgi:hypothetical protein